MRLEVKKQKVNKIKIIGGKYKGKNISFDYKETNDSHLRPTSNRARETLFNWLMFDISNSRCLDLFAGSGALSFEALSRGAELLTLIEYQNSICKSLSKIIHEFSTDTDKIQLINNDCVKFTEKNNQKQPYDIIFIDPPYNIIKSDFIESLITNLNKNGFTHNLTKIYIESDYEIKKDLVKNDLNIEKNKKIGSVYIYLCSLI